MKEHQQQTVHCSFMAGFFQSLYIFFLYGMTIDVGKGMDWLCRHEKLGGVALCPKSKLNKLERPETYCVSVDGQAKFIKPASNIFAK